MAPPIDPVTPDAAVETATLVRAMATELVVVLLNALAFCNVLLLPAQMPLTQIEASFTHMSAHSSPPFSTPPSCVLLKSSAVGANGGNTTADASVRAIHAAATPATRKLRRTQHLMLGAERWPNAGKNAEK
jgi:hypothetical protein